MALREILARFALEVQGEEKIEKADRSVSGLISSLKGLAIVAGGVALIGGLRKLVGGVADQAEALSALSAKTGQSTQELQRWAFVGDQVGVSAEGMAGALGFLTRAQGEALAGNKAAAQAFKDLHIEIEAAGGGARDSSELFREAVATISALPSAAERAAAAQGIFGRGARELMPVLAAGSEEIDRQLAAFDRLGGGLRDSTIKAVAEYDEANDNAKLAVTGLRGALAELLSPALTRMTTLVTEGVLKLTEWARKIDSGRVALAGLIVLAPLAFGQLASLARLALSPTGLLVLALAGAFVAVEDLITAYEGGQSVIADWYAEASGGTRDLTEDLEVVSDALRFMLFTVGELGHSFGVLGGVVTKFFRMEGAGFGGIEKIDEMLAKSTEKANGFKHKLGGLQYQLAQLSPPPNDSMDVDPDAEKRASLEKQIALQQRLLASEEETMRVAMEEKRKVEKGTFWEEGASARVGDEIDARWKKFDDETVARNTARALLRETAKREGKRADLRDPEGKLQARLEGVRSEKDALVLDRAGLVTDLAATPRDNASTGVSTAASDLEERLAQADARIQVLVDEESKVTQALGMLTAATRDNTAAITAPVPGGGEAAAPGGNVYQTNHVRIDATEPTKPKMRELGAGFIEGLAAHQ